MEVVAPCNFVDKVKNFCHIALRCAGIGQWKPSSKNSVLYDREYCQSPVAFFGHENGQKHIDGSFHIVVKANIGNSRFKDISCRQKRR